MVPTSRLMRILAVLGVGVLSLFAVSVASALGGSTGSSRGPDVVAPQVKAPAAQAADVPGMAPSREPDPSSSSYVSITPCRLVDTRVAGGKFAANETRSYSVTGSTLSGQGGKTTCGVPAGAAAVSLSITATAETAPGFLVVYPGNSRKPGGRSVSFSEGVDVTGTATTGIAPTATSEFRINASAPTQVMVDVTGYYTTQIHDIVLADGSLWWGTQHITSIDHAAGSGTYTLYFDRSVAGCDVATLNNGSSDVIVSGQWGGNDVLVTTSLASGGTTTVHDEAFQVIVMC